MRGPPRVAVVLLWPTALGPAGAVVELRGAALGLLQGCWGWAESFAGQVAVRAGMETAQSTRAARGVAQNGPVSFKSHSLKENVGRCFARCCVFVHTLYVTNFAGPTAHERGS